METKGICSLCGNTVFGHQERGKDQKGSYFHMSCVGVSAGTHVPHYVAPVCLEDGDAKACAWAPKRRRLRLRQGRRRRRQSRQSLRPRPARLQHQSGQ